MAALNIIVTAKQVIDHELPASALTIDETSTQVTALSSFKPIVNGFDDYALEAALRLKEAGGANITVLSVGRQFDVNTMRKNPGHGGRSPDFVPGPGLCQSRR